MDPFALYILDTLGRTSARKVHTIIQELFIRKVSFRFYAKSKFCVCFELHILVQHVLISPLIFKIFAKISDLAAVYRRN